MESNQVSKTEQNGGVSLLDTNLITTMKDFLKSWRPTTKVDAVRMLSFLSITNNPTATKRLKDEAYSFLDNRCAECTNAIDPVTGLEVTRVEVEKKVYNITAKTAKIEAQIAVLKDQLKREQEKAGVSHTEKSFYYKLK